MSTKHCSMCGESGHDYRDHDDSARSRSVKAGQLVYEDGLSFAEAGRRVGISRQAAYQGWCRYVHLRDLRKT